MSTKKPITEFSIRVCSGEEVCGINVTNGLTVSEAIAEARSISKNVDNPCFVVMMRNRSDYGFSKIKDVLHYFYTKDAFNAISAKIR